MVSKKHKAFLIIVVRCIDTKRILSKMECQQTSFNRQKCVKQESKLKGVGDFNFKNSWLSKLTKYRIIVNWLNFHIWWIHNATKKWLCHTNLNNLKIIAMCASPLSITEVLLCCLNQKHSSHNVNCLP